MPSEGAANAERAAFQKQESERQEAKRKEQIQKVIKEINDNYDGIKGLLPEVNKEAWKSLLFLRKQLRKLRGSWLMKQLDARTPHIEKDVLLGQYNSVLLLFDLIDRFRDIHSKLTPGHEEDVVRSLLFPPNPHGPDQTGRAQR